MKQTAKYPIKFADAQTIKLPIGAEVLHAGLDHQGVLGLWMLIDPKAELESVDVRITVTGAEIPVTVEYAGSFLYRHKLWHIFTNKPDKLPNDNQK